MEKREKTKSIPYLVGRGDVKEDILVVVFPNETLSRYEGIAVAQVVGLFSAFHTKEVLFVIGNQTKPLLWHGHNADGENMPYAGYYVINIDNVKGEVSLA